MRNIIEMAIKLLFFCRKIVKITQAPSVIRLSCIDLFGMEPKLDNFGAKKNLRFVQAPFLFAKSLFQLLVAFIPVDRYFKGLYGPHMK